MGKILKSSKHFMSFLSEFNNPKSQPALKKAQPITAATLRKLAMNNPPNSDCYFDAPIFITDSKPNFKPKKLLF